MHLVGIKRGDLSYKYFILNYKQCGNTGNICILNMAQQTDDVDCTSSAENPSWRDKGDDDTNVTMTL